MAEKRPQRCQHQKQRTTRFNPNFLHFSEQFSGMSSDQCVKESLCLSSENIREQKKK